MGSAHNPARKMVRDLGLQPLFFVSMLVTQLLIHYSLWFFSFHFIIGPFIGSTISKHFLIFMFFRDPLLFFSLHTVSLCDLHHPPIGNYNPCLQHRPPTRDRELSARTAGGQVCLFRSPDRSLERSFGIKPKPLPHPEVGSSCDLHLKNITVQEGTQW